MKWNSININAQNIETSTGKSVLVKMPNKSNYAGYKFWHPAKLVRENGGKGYHLTLSFNAMFEFKLLQYGKGYNRFEVIHQVVLNAEEFEKEFNSMSEAIDTANMQHEDRMKKGYEVNEIIHTPEVVGDVEVEVDESLKR